MQSCMTIMPNRLNTVLSRFRWILISKGINLPESYSFLRDIECLHSCHYDIGHAV